MKVLRGLLLPILVLTYNKKRLSREDVFVVIQYMLSLLVAICFQETGKRSDAGNFYWGLYSAGFFLMAFVWMRLAENISDVMADEKQASNMESKYLWGCGILSIWHLVSGIIYFVIISIGGKGVII